VGVEFGRVLEENQSMVYSLALRFLGNRALAEELAQEVFLQLYRQWARIESPAHATAWLRRTTCHRCIDEVRKRRLRPRLGLDDIPEPRDAGTQPDTMLQDRIRRLVEKLPEKARIVVLLRYQEDMDPSEISDLLDMPVSTVKSHLHRSLALLRERLREKEVCL
jgi:RNA polymerase sigma-70 factor (ECF subfamily)